ncbi:Two-component sensor histidine kinase, contains HisKA and HATPase domains [Sphingomonas guangdongensis]|uniref:histidine kinase n=2 Tax=Sphingomonas guangdongensis TaxID=1141890 RepID=A0A285QFM0_9SPHN|nr:Two-component sensor histidine kinase, contains HisKA and HATPase domains [Sphingomonas guangdongensis]
MDVVRPQRFRQADLMVDETDSGAVLRYAILDTAPEQGFDDLTALASEICDVPTALVSLLDSDRQWFKAKVGFEPRQTGLDSSVCRHVVREATTIVIPDLTKDERTRDNPLVTGKPGIRFYAGAPLATCFGVVGALCVIDTVPRPEGLTLRQRTSLERLARQAVLLLEARRDSMDLRELLAAQSGADAALSVSEGRWRQLYRNMDQGFIYARALRDKNGVIYDWRYEDVNKAWGSLVGIDADFVRGRTIREVIPEIEEEWVTGLARVVDTHNPARFTSRVGSSNRWYDGTAQWVGGDDFTVIFHETTARVEAVRRRDALLVLGDMIRDSLGTADMLAKAAEVIGVAVDASRATIGEFDHNRERIAVDAGWALPSMPPIGGSYRFEDYGRIREKLVQGETLIIEDVETDPRTADAAADWRALKARAVVNIPVKVEGRTTIVLIVHREEPYAWTEDEVAFLRNAADRLETAIARRREEERQDVVNKEIAHRLKNSLAMTQAIALQTLRGDASSAGLEAFAARLQSLGAAHDALTMGRWKAAVLTDVLAGVLDSVGVRGRCDISGPEIAMGSRASMSTSLLIHELATNAMKYGALSSEKGRVSIEWRVDGVDDDGELILEWTERGGPPTVASTRKGFGSRLVRLGLVGTGGSTVRYDQTGLKACFRASLSQVEQA